MKVFVYYNLHKHLWSVKALEGEHKGKVIAHRNSVMLLSPEGKVSQAGRKRVLEQQQKNVHAGIVGEWLEQREPMGFDMWDEITYNPYKYEGFVYKDSEDAFDGASLAWMQDRKVYVI
jgi:hypothetical protein